MENDYIIISLGGSLIVPEEVDGAFLKDFKTLIEEYVSKGKKFGIITGGGKTCRKYNDAANMVREMSHEELDWLGIYATRFNAELLRILFGDLAEDKVVIDPNMWKGGDKSIAIGAGWKPGTSSDIDAVLMAKAVGTKVVINLSNIDYAYDSDPRTNPEAKPIKSITWGEYRKLIPTEWTPGLSSPFDPTASREAQDLKLKVVIMNGKNLDNLRAFIDGKDFVGTLIY